MTPYGGDFAQLYDVFHGDKPYEAEAEFVDRLIREDAEGSSNTLLDIACGTGRHAVHLASLGWAVVGVDQSADMLEVAADRAEGLNVTLIRQDMAGLDLGTRDFDAAVCLFDSIGYGVDNDSIAATLSGARRHLRPGGLFAAEFWHAPAMLRDFDPLRVREWEVTDGRVMRISRTGLDVAAQTATVEYTVYHLGGDGTFTRWQESHTNRYFMVQEMDVMLRASGLQPIRWLAGFDDTRAIDETTWHVLVLARAANGAAP